VGPRASRPRGEGAPVTRTCPTPQAPCFRSGFYHQSFHGPGERQFNPEPPHKQAPPLRAPKRHGLSCTKDGASPHAFGSFSVLSAAARRLPATRVGPRVTGEIPPPEYRRSCAGQPLKVWEGKARVNADGRGMRRQVMRAGRRRGHTPRCHSRARWYMPKKGTACPLTGLACPVRHHAHCMALAQACRAAGQPAGRGAGGLAGKGTAAGQCACSLAACPPPCSPVGLSIKQNISEALQSVRRRSCINNCNNHCTDIAHSDTAPPAAAAPAV
jgi:hypothetical protein